jgi:alkylhydroperoxidase/carboxymuconolactone decarboxylase family protein YurZ
MKTGCCEAQTGSPVVFHTISMMCRGRRRSGLELGSNAAKRFDATNPTTGRNIMTDTTNESDTPVLDLLARMTADSLEASNLDSETLMLVRIAALVAVGAPAVSYLLNLEVAVEMGLDPEKLRGVLAAVAPIVGTARVAAATGNIVKALAVEIEVAELDSQYEE